MQEEGKRDQNGEETGRQNADAFQIVLDIGIVRVELNRAALDAGKSGRGSAAS